MSGYVDAWESAPEMPLSWASLNPVTNMISELSVDSDEGWGRSDARFIARKKHDERSRNVTPKYTDRAKEADKIPPDAADTFLLFRYGSLGAFAGALLVVTGYFLGVQKVIYFGLFVLGLGLMSAAAFVIDDGSESGNR